MAWSFYNANGVLLRTGLGVNNIQSTTLTTATQISTTGGTFTDITGLSTTITPISSSSKIRVSGVVCLSVATTDAWINIRLLRGSTAIGQPTSAGSRLTGNVAAYFGQAAQISTVTIVPVPFEFVDSPATTSATTYKLQFGSNVSCTLSVNRSSDDSDNINRARATSTITAIEHIQ